MPTIKLKRVYSPYDENDGFRVLVDRLWPRGIKKENLKMDLWEKDIAPSNELREWFHQDTATQQNEFSVRYDKELENSSTFNAFVDKIKSYDTVTLLYAAHDEQQNNAIILKEVLENKLKTITQ